VTDLPEGPGDASQVRHGHEPDEDADCDHVYDGCDKAQGHEPRALSFLAFRRCEGEDATQLHVLDLIELGALLEPRLELANPFAQAHDFRISNREATLGSGDQVAHGTQVGNDGEVAFGGGMSQIFDATENDVACARD
jgi:hypothetical protein